MFIAIEKIKIFPEFVIINQIFFKKNIPGPFKIDFALISKELSLTL